MASKRTVKPTSAPQLEAEHELAVLRAVVDGMAEGVWITSADGTVVQHNNALKEMLFSGQALIGRKAGDLVDSPELKAAVTKACSEGHSSRLELSHHGLLPRTLSIHVSPLSQTLPGSAAVFFDVTELRRLEKVRKDFVANVSHELRTPITAIRGYAETLQTGALADALAAPKMIDIIHRQAVRLSELVDDLLELSQLESRQLKLTAQAVDLLEATNRAAEAVRPKARARSSAIEVHVPKGLTAWGDPRAIEQIVLNLVDNAVKYSHSNGHVWVTAEVTAPTTVTVRVRDDGPGIEAKHLPRLFERFYRVDKGRSRDMGGTGLGLSIVKHLVTAMDGEVRVTSTPGSGSSFFIELPLSAPE
jgi:two-component system, OmpR family, phosphate regulon sensor histidine kinase PhoR